MHITQEKRVALIVNYADSSSKKTKSTIHAEALSCSLTFFFFFCNSTGSKTDTWKTCGHVFMPVIPVKDYSPTLDLDPRGASVDYRVFC